MSKKVVLFSLLVGVALGIEEPATTVLGLIGNLDIVGWGPSKPRPMTPPPPPVPTGPVCRDADRDGVPDYLDRCPNTPPGMPVDQKGCPILYRFPLRLLFDFNRSQIKKIYYPQLKKVAEVLKNNPYMKIEIAGYTDDVGSKLANTKLSYQRALAVKKALVDHFGIDPKRIIVVGYGESRPLVPNTTETNRALNRRVDIIDITNEIPASALPKPTPTQLAYCQPTSRVQLVPAGGGSQSSSAGAFSQPTSAGTPSSTPTTPKPALTKGTTPTPTPTSSRGVSVPLPPKGAKLKYPVVKTQQITPPSTGKGSSEKGVYYRSPVMPKQYPLPQPIVPEPPKPPYQRAFLPKQQWDLEEVKVIPVIPPTSSKIYKPIPINPSSPMKNGPAPKVTIEYLN